MLPTLQLVDQISIANQSYCTKIQRWLCHKKTTQMAKMAFWYIGSTAAAFIPIPYVNGLITGSMLFMGAHVTMQHPDSICMRGAFRSIAMSRTWKHIVTGMLICRISWSGGTIALTSTNFSVKNVGLLVMLVGCGLSLMIAYSNSIFPGQPEFIILENETDT